MWQGLGLLFGLSFVVLLVATLVTPPESTETLKQFYARCRPPGFWGPISREVQLEDTGDPSTGRMFFDSMLGIAASLGLVLGTNAIYVGDWPRFGGSLVLCLVAGGLLLKRMLNAPARAKPAPKPEQVTTA
jgi:solute:Na+ symporter, SSS family